MFQIIIFIAEGTGQEMYKSAFVLTQVPVAEAVSVGYCPGVSSISIDQRGPSISSGSICYNEEFKLIVQNFKVAPSGLLSPLVGG